MAALMLLMLRVVQIRWTRTWAEKGGRARAASAAADNTPDYGGSPRPAKPLNS
jgi:NNP family nitrate/nitrite transporter-like MFS transporter